MGINERILDLLQNGSADREGFHYIRGSHTGQSNTSYITLQLPTDENRQWMLRAIAVHRSSGTATNVAPRVGQTNNFANDSADDRLGVSSTAVGTPINLVVEPPVPMQTDADRRLYLKLGYDAGADNAGTHQIWLSKAWQTPESST